MGSNVAINFFFRICTNGPSSLTNHTLLQNMLWMIIYEPPQHYLSNPDRGIIRMLNWQSEVLLLLQLWQFQNAAKTFYQNLRLSLCV